MDFELTERLGVRMGVGIRRPDCRRCQFKKECGDMFVDEGKCPANMGGEEWAKFTPEPTAQEREAAGPEPWK